MGKKQTCKQRKKPGKRSHSNEAPVAVAGTHEELGEVEEAPTKCVQLRADSVYDIAKYLPHQDTLAFRQNNSFFNDCALAYPLQFKQRPLLDLLVFTASYQFPPEKQWPDDERFKHCCGHLKELSNKLIGERFFTNVPVDQHVAIETRMRDYRRMLRYDFPNELTKETAYHAVHFLSHLSGAGFEEMAMNSSNPLYTFHPMLSELFRHIHVRLFWNPLSCMYSEFPKLDVVASLLKPSQRLRFSVWHATHFTEMVQLLEDIAVSGRHHYSSLIFKVTNFPESLEASQTDYEHLIDSVIQFYKHDVKDLRWAVDVTYTFEGFGLPSPRCPVPKWSLAPFSKMKPIKVEQLPKRKKIYTYNVSTADNKQAFQVVVEHKKHGWIEAIKFRFGP